MRGPVAQLNRATSFNEAIPQNSKMWVIGLNPIRITKKSTLRGLFYYLNS